MGRDRASSVSEDRDWKTSNFVTEDISLFCYGRIMYFIREIQGK